MIAVTYDEEFGGDNGAKWEVGVMLFTPPVLLPAPQLRQIGAVRTSGSVLLGVAPAALAYFW